jgi:hypothetical protein
MRKGSENYLMDNLFLCIRRTEHQDANEDRNQIAEKSSPQKEIIARKELLLPELFSRIHSSPFSIRRALSVIKNYWKK